MHVVAGRSAAIPTNFTSKELRGLMRNRLAVVAALLVGLAAGSVATAATGWKVMATKTAKGDVVTYGTVSAKTLNPNALAVRASGPANTIEWSMRCSGVADGNLAGKILPVSVESAAGCEMFVTATGDAGTLRLQLLRR